MAMSSVDLIAILGSVFGSALALGIMTMRITARIDADRRAFQAEAAQDCRALQATMDRHQATMDRYQAGMDAYRAGMEAYRADMQRLAERQSGLEARQEAQQHRAPGGAG